MKIIESFKDFFFTVFHVGHWFRNHPTDKYWDQQLNILLDNKPTFTEFQAYTLRLNGVLIWVSNYPYCYGHPYPLMAKSLPSRSTARKLQRMALSAYIKQETKNR